MTIQDSEAVRIMRSVTSNLRNEDKYYPTFHCHETCSPLCIPPLHAMTVYLSNEVKLDNILRYLPKCGVTVHSHREIYEFETDKPLMSVDMITNDVRHHDGAGSYKRCYLFMVSFDNKANEG